MGGAKLLTWRLAAEGATLLKSRAALILTIPGCFSNSSASQMTCTEVLLSCSASLPLRTSMSQAIGNLLKNSPGVLPLLQPVRYVDIWP